MGRVSGILAVLVLMAAACTPPPPSSNTSQVGGSAAVEPQHVLVIANRFEPMTLSSKGLLSGGESTYLINNLFNAGLGLQDESGLFSLSWQKHYPS